MCEVCAIFGVSAHWSDAAPVGELAAASPAGAARAIQQHRGERRRRLEILNEWVAPRDVIVEDWDGEAFAVRAPDGRMRIAPDLSALWPHIEALGEALFDPLEDGGWVGSS
jgi:hypothetical protein